MQFDLVDTTGMSEDQLREIPYTVVETHSTKRSNSASAKVHKTIAKDRVDRIRGYLTFTLGFFMWIINIFIVFLDSIYVPESNSVEPIINGSIRSASTISSKDCDKNSSLVR